MTPPPTTSRSGAQRHGAGTSTVRAPIICNRPPRSTKNKSLYIFFLFLTPPQQRLLWTKDPPGRHPRPRPRSGQAPHLLTAPAGTEASPRPTPGLSPPRGAPAPRPPRASGQHQQRLGPTKPPRGSTAAKTIPGALSYTLRSWFYTYPQRLARASPRSLTLVRPGLSTTAYGASSIGPRGTPLVILSYIVINRASLKLKSYWHSG